MFFFIIVYTFLETLHYTVFITIILNGKYIFFSVKYRFINI